MYISSLVLNFGNAAFTIEAVESELTQTRPPDEILIVDNGSLDDSLLTLNRHFASEPRVTLLALPENLGIPGAMTRGFERILESECVDAILVQHNDTNLNEAALAHLVSCLDEHDQVGAVAPLQVAYDTPDLVLSAGCWLRSSYWWCGHYGYRHSLQQVRGNPPVKIDWLDFTCVLIRRECLTATGMPQSSYQFFWEDVEWCIRAGRRGWGFQVCTDAILRHRVGATLGTRRSDTYHRLSVVNRFRSAVDSGVKSGYWKMVLHELALVLKYSVRQGDLHVAKVRLPALLHAITETRRVLA